MYAAGYGPYGDGTTDAIIWMSTNDGYDWTRLSTIRQLGDAGINETTLAKVGPTTLLAVSRDDAGTHTWAHFSSDMGSSWGPQRLCPVFRVNDQALFLGLRLFLGMGCKGRGHFPFPCVST
jgi:hypothetical protein